MDSLCFSHPLISLKSVSSYTDSRLPKLPYAIFVVRQVHYQL